MSDLKPLERIEFYLDAIAEKIGGNEVEVPEPQTREEYFLKKIVDNASSGGGGVVFNHKTFKIVPHVVTSKDFLGDIVCDISTGTISRVTISEEYGNLAPIDLGIEQNNGEISFFGTPQPNDMCYAVSEGPQGYMFALIAEFDQQYQVLVTGTNCTVQTISVNNFGIAIPTNTTETAIITVTIKDGES